MRDEEASNESVIKYQHIWQPRSGQHEVAS